MRGGVFQRRDAWLKAAFENAQAEAEAAELKTETTKAKEPPEPKDKQ